MKNLVFLSPATLDKLALHGSGFSRLFPTRYLCDINIFSNSSFYFLRLNSISVFINGNSDLTEYKNTFQHALHTAKNLMAKRNHFSQELVQKLENRGFPISIIQNVTAECVKLNYLNDQESGRGYIEELIRKGYGPGKIRYKLNTKGLDTPLIDELFLENRVIEREHETAEKVMNKKLSQLSSESNPLKIKNKIFRFMHYRGFSVWLIRKLMTKKLDL